VRLLWDARQPGHRRTGGLAVPAWRPDDLPHARPRWRVVARRGPGQQSWDLLTRAAVQTAAEAWQAVAPYARRGPLALRWRYGESELALERPRRWRGKRRQTLRLRATLADAFLLSRLAPSHQTLRQWLLRCWCHRTGKRSRDASTPLDRLRSALSRLWLAYRPDAHPALHSSG
jgi:hypothetical protein